MRNLKKILAMVLALVMSLSLMATAGASSFADASSINDTYETAIEVLSGLGVFNGYKEDGTFRPQGSITRAETAAIIYRIVTGDVNDEQVGIYADYNLFTDVPNTSWYAGYVNFCANAEYIKGLGNGKFDPQGQVTGYAALAMILRAIGYTANGGFTGSDWQVQTARTAEARKITKNITSGTLGQPATREIVAEVLFQAIMVNMVDHNVLNTLNGNQGYTEINETLGHKTFGLDKISGVVMANEWANLEDDEVLDDDNTRIIVTDAGVNAGLEANEINKQAVKVGDELTLVDQETSLNAVGMTYDFYVANDDSSRSSTNMRSLGAAESDINDVKFNEGASKTVTGLAGSLKLTDETEYYVNYADQWFDDVTSTYRVAYAISKAYVDNFAGQTIQAYFQALSDDDGITETKYRSAGTTWNGYAIGGHYFGIRDIKVNWDVNDDDVIDAKDTIPCYYVAIRPEFTINELDQENMREIFAAADWISVNNTNTILGEGTVQEILKNYALGEVYAGTTSMKDWSDEISWAEYRDKFFDVDVNSRKFSNCDNGESLRIIDNNGDGVAEYVLRIDYTQDKIVGTYKNEALCNTVAMADYEDNLLYNPDNLSSSDQGTVVNYTVIDGKLYIYTADVITGTVTTKNWKDVTVTVNGETYGQSGIENETKMLENIMLMDDATEYNIYFDEFGYIRSYELAQDHRYALLTEMYPTGSQQSAYVNNYQSMVEMKVGDGEIAEHYVKDTYATAPGLFFSPYVWTFGRYAFQSVSGNAPGTVVPSAYNNTPNYLQPAVAHLGAEYDVSAARTSNYGSIGATDSAASYVIPGWYTYWAAGVQASWTAPGTVGPNNWIGVFDYGPERSANHSFSLTNVAAYTENEDGSVTLKTAAQLATNSANDAQLFRVSSEYIASTGKTLIPDWKIGTRAELEALYVANYKATEGDAAAANAADWFEVGRATKAGVGIYPVYAEDYVQLDLTKDGSGKVLDADDVAVTAGTRHYRVDDNYKAYYNTNSNAYVDSTVDTEVYIVMPDRIMYKVGFADLPSIKVGEIRAAYAVAKNVNADSDGQDYWVADVIVIETSALSVDYESISLAFYNPFETSNSVRYVETLNNEWKNLQPTYEDKAEMTIVPKKNTTYGNTVWGNYSWSDNSYGFYKLYDTELAEEGEMNVGSITQILSDFNDYGIYAGEVTRKNHLQSSGYLDVDTIDTGSGFTQLIDVNYGEANEVPFYRISGTSANGGKYSVKEITLNAVEDYSDVKINDKIIWVYNVSQNELAFVVDLTVNDVNGDGLINNNDWICPAWLLRLYNNILLSQQAAPTARTITFDIDSAVTSAVTETVDSSVYDVTDVFSEIRVATTIEGLAEADAKMEAVDGIYTITVPLADKYYWSYTFATGFSGINSTETVNGVTYTIHGPEFVITSDNADFGAATVLGNNYNTIDVLDDSVSAIRIVLDSSTVEVDISGELAADLAAYKTAAEALVDDYAAKVEAENPGLEATDLATVVTAAKAAINAVTLTGDTREALETAKEAIDALISVNAEGVYSGTEKTAIDNAAKTALTTDEMPEAVNGVVTLTKDVELDGSYTVPTGVTKIDLAGHDITFDISSGSGIVVQNGADVLITGEGKISISTEGSKLSNVVMGVRANGDAKVTIGAGVTVEASKEAASNGVCYTYAVGAVNSGTSAGEDTVIDVYGTVIGGGGIYMGGHVSDGKITVNVYEGANVEGEGWAIYDGGDGDNTLNVFGGTIAGGNGGINVCGGYANILGGKIGVGSVATVGTRPAGGGSYASGSDIAVTPYLDRDTIVVIGEKVVLDDTSWKLGLDVAGTLANGKTIRVTYPKIAVGSAITYFDGSQDDWTINYEDATGLVTITMIGGVAPSGAE